MPDWQEEANAAQRHALKHALEWRTPLQSIRRTRNSGLMNLSWWCTAGYKNGCEAAAIISQWLISRRSLA